MAQYFCKAIRCHAVVKPRHPEKILVKRLDAVVKPALLHGSKKVPYVILAKGGNLEKILKINKII